MKYLKLVLYTSNFRSYYYGILELYENSSLSVLKINIVMASRETWRGGSLKDSYNR